MKILFKYDMDAYHAGYYHSYEQSINQKEMSEFQKTILLNKLHLHYMKKDLLDYLSFRTKDPQNTMEFYERIIKNHHFYQKMDCLEEITEYRSFLPLKTEIKKGGLYKDWDFSF
jgi:hypothetical protein